MPTARGNSGPERSHRRVSRPWGYYESIDAGERVQVKRLMVKPGGYLGEDDIERFADDYRRE